MNAQEDVVFATVNEQQQDRDLLDQAREDGYNAATVPEDVRHEIRDSSDVEGNEIRDVDTYSMEYNESFEYKWVDETDLTTNEQSVWGLRHDIFDLLDDLPQIEEIRISETMCITGSGGWKTRGTWQQADRRIVVHRDVLSDPKEFAEVLLHEIAHPKSGNAPDQTREFEHALTQLLGEVAVSSLEKNSGFSDWLSDKFS